MTGFGDVATQGDGVHYAVELRSLNNKYFKTSLRLPETIQGLEPELETALRKRINRGSLTLTVKMRATDAHAANRVNEAAVLTYLDHLETIHSKISDQSVQIDLTQLLALPGVLQPSEDEEVVLAKARPIVLKLTDQACDKLGQMRISEGKAVGQDILAQCEVIREQLGHVKERAPQVIEEYHQRLRQRIEELTHEAKLRGAHQDLIREVAVFAERSDISEELSRTAEHITQLGKVVQGEGQDPAGRTIDFLAQELLREANTIASKSNDAAISRAAVQMKSAIDRIKEQAQNVE